MVLENLERLVERRQLDRHQATRREIENHLVTAREYAAASRAEGVAQRIRFLNLYDAAHAVSLAGLKLAGYRAKDGEGNRQAALGSVEQTLALRMGTAAAFTEANRLRALMQYQGSDVDAPDSLFDRMEAGVAEALDEVSRRLRAARLG